MRKAKDHILIISSFFPGDEAGRGPWGQRYKGLYGGIFRHMESSWQMEWYSVAENRLYIFSPKGTEQHSQSIYIYLLRQLFSSLYFRTKTKFIISYPCFRGRQFLKTVFFISVLKLLQQFHQSKVYLDFVDPPLMMMKIYNENPLLRKILPFLCYFQEKAYMRTSEVIITNADQMALYLRQKYRLVSGKFVSIPMGINVNDFSPDPQRFQRNGFTIFYGGTISEERGVLQLFDSIERVNKIHPVTLLCCGPMRQSLEIPHAPWLKVYTDLSYQEYVNLLISSADVGIIPYPVNEWWNKVSISKLATYTAAGIPTLTTNIQHTAEFLRYWNCGLVAENWEIMDKLIVQLYEDRNLCSTLGINAREAAEKALDWSVLVSKLEKILQFD
jgi:glycosyltransferase involved in cell wall biosynthesis